MQKIMRIRIKKSNLVEIPIDKIAVVEDIQIYGKGSNNGNQIEKSTDTEPLRQHDLNEMTSFGGDG